MHSHSHPNRLRFVRSQNFIWKGCYSIYWKCAIERQMSKDRCFPCLSLIHCDGVLTIYKCIFLSVCMRNTMKTTLSLTSKPFKMCKLIWREKKRQTLLNNIFPFFLLLFSIVNKNNIVSLFFYCWTVKLLLLFDELVIEHLII
jgi:hypothetical protein